ncbi:hypothetical protein TH25_16705 [Thalassospira profundimaris]|uniref:Uncharacterized protein n=1 Tax=Thalassospira profundimaris TaxID=502049 RepID=A0A367WYM9_9PROT|nr:hypothetical protein [Thalassospira profundimaris]RCK46497.1 hypothetical protein TH25_16705 [Thalassospira profundimaris]
MISETTLAKKYTSFWNEILPNLKNYIRIINNGLLNIEYPPIPESDRKNNIALVNVISFEMLRHCSKDGNLPRAYSNFTFFNTEQFNQILQKSITYLSKFKYQETCTLPLTHIEKLQIHKIFYITYKRYFITDKKSIIDPKFDGCGFVNESFGDIISKKTLVEIKSGERRFSSTDARQMITYLTLNNYSKSPYKIERIELFNPRMGISFTENTEDFCKNVSALSPQELYTEVQKFISDNNFIEIFDT